MNCTNSNNIIFLDNQNANDDFDQKQNLIVYSQLGEGIYPTSNSGISVKFVLQGSENYRIGNKTYPLIPGKYLVVNAGKDLDCVIESKKDADGVCIFLSPHMVQDVYNVLCNGENSILKDTDENGKNTIELHENIFSFQSYRLGNILENIAGNLVLNRKNSTIQEDLFYRLTEQLILSQQEITRQIYKIKTVKNSTRQELFRRLFVAKEMIDDCPGDKLDIPAISKQAALSEYHFIRTFSQVYGISPYKYHVKTRLNKALQLLSENKISVTDAACQSGFSDIFSFSKAFKKEFGLNPSELSQKRFF